MEAAARARERYACFEQFGDDPQAYGYMTSLELTQDCEKAVIAQLLELQQQRTELLQRHGHAREDEQLEAEQNARVVKNAEEYYRAMFQGRTSSWNLRDTHMADTVDEVVGHLGRDGREPRLGTPSHADCHGVVQGNHGRRHDPKKLFVERGDALEVGGAGREQRLIPRRGRRPLAHQPRRHRRHRQ